ncbi:MAG TPA: hypothetical protein VF546_04055 [Pyrinomonadaceae bacterium]|jgi:hypothetical protein
MRKVFLFALPLLTFFAPALSRLHLRPTDAARHGAVEAAALAPDQLALSALHARIREARALLDAQTPAPADTVALVVAAAADAPLQVLQVPKALFTSQDAETLVRTAGGAPLRLRVVRANYVNTAVAVTDAAGRALEPLLVRYPVEKQGALSEVAYYTSAHPALAQPALARAGGAYVRRTLDAAAARLAGQGVRIAPDVVAVAERLAVVEHADHKRFATEDHATLFDEIRTLYALNAGDTYRYSVSTAGAGGMIQMIPQTYQAVRAQHPAANLDADFVAGMRDHENAARAMLLYMQDTWDGLLRSEEVRQALATGLATQAELLAAGYNSNPARLPSYLKRGGAGWRALIPAETQTYLRIYAAVDSLAPAASRS